MVKQDLKRIEAVLNQLERGNASPSLSSTSHSGTVIGGSLPPNPSIVRSPSFKILATESLPTHSTSVTLPSVQPFPLVSSEVSPLGDSSGSTTIDNSSQESLQLERASAYSSVDMPDAVIQLLKEIGDTLTLWKQELEWVTGQIQTLSLEGPIVEGWLESTIDAPSVIHASTEPTQQAFAEQWPSLKQWISLDEELERSGHTCYRLCGFDTEGNPWSHPCPEDQIPAVSLAIARYQKLRQLNQRKQDLENHFSHLGRTLAVFREQLY